jgi:hypothetical protein
LDAFAFAEWCKFFARGCGDADSGCGEARKAGDGFFDFEGEGIDFGSGAFEHNTDVVEFVFAAVELCQEG